MIRPLVVLSIALLAIDASAYVRSRTPHGTPTHWASSCALVQPDSTGSPDLDPTATQSTIQDAMAQWRNASMSCSYFAIDYVAPAVLDAHFDGVNTIKFRTDTWCHPNDDQSNDVCYSSAAAGITTVFYVDRPGDSADGNIIDADVELNNIDFTFDFVDATTGRATKAPRTGTQIADFENTLVHELGHLQGLDHTCKDGATPGQEVDDTGNPPPDCDALQALTTEERSKIQNATMYNSAGPAETKKRTPEADDAAGICNAYPISSAPAQCGPADLNSYKKSGCELGGSMTGTFPIFAFLLLGIALRATRRRA